MISGLVNMVLGVLAGAGYPGIAAIVGLESVGLPLPGETTLLAASYLASTGQLSLPLVIGAAALGAVIGDSVGYFVGRKGGRRFLERYGRYVGITPGKLEKADWYFARHGAKTVFFGRFVAVLRILAGPLAGASNMPYRRFLTANISGAVVWAATMGTLGFFFGKPVGVFLGQFGIWAFVALAAFLILRFMLRRRRSRGRLTPQPPPSPTASTGPLAKPAAARAR